MSQTRAAARLPPVALSGRPVSLWFLCHSPCVCRVVRGTGVCTLLMWRAVCFVLCREAVAVVCEAVPGAKGAQRRRKVPALPTMPPPTTCSPSLSLFFNSGSFKPAVKYTHRARPDKLHPCLWCEHHSPTCIGWYGLARPSAPPSLKIEGRQHARECIRPASCGFCQAASTLQVENCLAQANNPVYLFRLCDGAFAIKMCSCKCFFIFVSQNVPPLITTCACFIYTV